MLDFLKRKKKLTQAELEFIKKKEKVISKSLNSLLHTDEIERFFTDYRIAKSATAEIAGIAGWDTKCIAGMTPEECLNSLQNEFSEPLNNCITNYIRKETVRIMGMSRGRIKAANGVVAIINEYAEDMPSESAAFAKNKAAEMMKKIEKLEE